IGTNPSEQARVLNGSDITLIVSQGARQEVVPEVVGLMERDAIAALNDAGFPVGEPTTRYSDTVPQGEVMSSTPAQGETVRHDAEVSLELSDGPEPISIPDVVGSTESAAVAALEEFALQVTVERERTREAPRGEVFRQNPDAGADGIRTQAITIWVSDGPPLVQLSDYSFNTVDRARSELEELGLNVNLEADNPWPWTTPEFVVGQRPAPGTQLEVGSTVTLVYDS
ncbi:MAG: PASTA domain-containing protein, partial [Demequina sp.]